MFTSNTYRVLNMMVLLSHYYGKEAVSIDRMVSFCLVDAETVTSLLCNLEELGLVKSSETHDAFSLTKSPRDIRLYDFIKPFEPSVFSGKEAVGDGVPAGKRSELFYRKFSVIQEVIEKKLRRCRLSDWSTVDESTIYTI